MEVDALTASAVLGFLGGAIRVLVGVFKSMAVKRKIYWNYAVFTAIVAGLIGILTGIVFSFDPRLSILAGYAGTDILEGIYKSFKVEKVYVRSK
ncbi:MAG: hypothetical protein AABX07_04490 [Nanoarchaeota archaeon]